MAWTLGYLVGSPARSALPIVVRSSVQKQIPFLESPGKAKSFSGRQKAMLSERKGLCISQKNFKIERRFVEFPTPRIPLLKPFCITCIVASAGVLT
jgi:hypothetical protein